MTQFTYRIVTYVPEGEAYAAARVGMASVTCEPLDATAEWRRATDGTTDPVTGAWVVTYRVANMLARQRDVDVLPTLAAQTGGGWEVLESGRGTPAHAFVQTLDQALDGAGLWLLEEVVDEETGEPTGELVRVER